MKIITTITDIRAHLRGFKVDSIALVPTMGSLHAGHLSLVKKAKAESDHVVISIFVNPLQFDDKTDLLEYPSDLERDIETCKAWGIDTLFTPSIDEIYGQQQTTIVDPGELSHHLCGIKRKGHFKGVATVVAKLFNIVEPDKAYFGEKDWQQLIIIKKMVMDLNFPIKVISVPTAREPDGLAISSRNKKLTDSERRSALIIVEALNIAKNEVEKESRDLTSIRLKVKELFDATEDIELEYFSICHPFDFVEMDEISRPYLLAVAAKIGKTRLIDNILVK